MSAPAADDLTQRVIAAFAATPEPRLRELLTALVQHLHAFAAETALTRPEWIAGIEFLTATGHRCDGERQEFILLSDVLGLSSLVEEVNAAEGATQSTVLGPFYLPGAPERAMGEQIGRPEDGSPTLVRGQVTDVAGRPLEGATLDVWQARGNGLYDIQDPRQPPFNLRGAFVTGPDGHYEFRTARPASYPIPTDGPVGALLRAAGRQHWRAAHIHAIVSRRPGHCPGHQPQWTLPRLCYWWLRLAAARQRAACGHRPRSGERHAPLVAEYLRPGRAVRTLVVPPTRVTSPFRIRHQLRSRLPGI